MDTSTHTETTFCTERNKSTLADLVQKIRLAAKDAVESSHDALNSAIAAGGHLVKAKEKVLYGKWGAWLAENFEFSQSVANSWMRLWDKRHELIALIKDMPKEYMSVQDALKLISTAPVPPPKTKFQKVKKRCVDLIKEIYSQSPAEAKKSRDLLIEHIKDVHDYVKEHAPK